MKTTLILLAVMAVGLTLSGCATVPRSVQELRTAEREAQLDLYRGLLDAREKPVAHLEWSIPAGTLIHVPKDGDSMMIRHEVRESAAGAVAVAQGGGKFHTPIPENPLLTTARIAAPIGATFVTGYFSDRALGKVVGLGGQAISSNTAIASEALAKEPVFGPPPTE